MKTNDIIIKNLQHWLIENEKSQKWLADEMNISELLVEHILSGKRSLLRNILKSYQNSWILQ